MTATDVRPGCMFGPTVCHAPCELPQCQDRAASDLTAALDANDRLLRAAADTVRQTRAPRTHPNGVAIPPDPGDANYSESRREALGRRVREVWVAWASEQPDPKPHWLTGWDDLDAGQREVDTRIGEALWRDGAAEALREAAAKWRSGTTTSKVYADALEARADEIHRSHQ